MTSAADQPEMRHYACAIFVADGRILLGKRSPHRKAYPDKWDVIGGFVEVGESLEQALVREIDEEVGVRPLAWDLVGPILDPGPDGRGDATYHMFAVRSWSGGEPRMANHEHTELRWFTIEEACALEDLVLTDYVLMFRSINP